MSYKALQQEFDQFNINPENIHFVNGLPSNIKRIQLSQHFFVVIKEFDNSEMLFKIEAYTIESLQQSLKDSYGQFFPHIYKIDNEKKQIYMEEAPMDLAMLIYQYESYCGNDIKYLFCQIVESLNQLHAIKFAHGDIKPKNILVYVNPLNQITLKLSDFGCSRKVIENEIPSEAFGTIGYIDQRIKACWDEDKFIYFDRYKSDMFALGIVLFQLLTKQIFNQQLLQFLDQSESLFWECVQYFYYPLTINWSDNLIQLFIKMVHPNENKRWENMNQILQTDWLKQAYKQIIVNREQDSEVEQLFQQYKHQLSLNNNSRAAKLDTQSRIHDFKKSDSFNMINESYNLDLPRKVDIIQFSKRKETDFISELSPQDLFILLLCFADVYSTNYEEINFIDKSQLIINAEYCYKETKVSLFSQSGSDYQQCIEEEDPQKIFSKIGIEKILKFQMKIWQIESEEKTSFKSWVEFKQIKKNEKEEEEDYSYFISHIYKNIIKIIQHM